MSSSSFILQHLFKIFESCLLKGDLGPEVLVILLELHNMLIHADLLILHPGYISLQFCLIRLLIVCNPLECVQLINQLVSFHGESCCLLAGILKLSCDVVDVALQGQNLLHKVLLFSLKFCYLETSPTCFLLLVL